ncbi:hypothetical protein M413DRAFT_445146, partial [Hebeloma cylindrosporum]
MSAPVSNQPLEGSIGHHHVHNPNEPLPGSRGAAPTVDYSPETIARTTLPPSEVGDTQDFHPHHSSTHYQHAPHHHPGHAEAGVTSTGPDTSSTRPSGNVHGQPAIQPTGSDDHSTRSDNKPSVGDKIVGKATELAGKAIRSPGLQEKGELRAQGEKK